MKKNLLTLSIAFLLTTSIVNAQFFFNDSIDLGEDRTSHNYVEYGSIGIGAYKCNSTDLSIRVGNGNSGDYIEFDMDVIPNTDTIMIELAVPWAGGDSSQLSSLTLDGDITGSIGNKGCDSVILYFDGVSQYTADSSVHIIISDSAASFAMDAQITYMKIYSTKVPPPSV